jgi:hypothetical protein
MNSKFRIEGRWVRANQGEMNGCSTRFLEQDALCRCGAVSPEFLEKLKTGGVISTLNGRYALNLIEALEAIGIPHTQEETTN